MRVELELKLGKGILPFVLGSPIREVLSQIQMTQSISMKKVMVKYVHSSSKDAYPGGKVLPHDILVDIISCGVLLRFSGISQMLTSIEIYNLKFVNILYKGILLSLKSSPSGESNLPSQPNLPPVSMDSGSNSLSDVIENSVVRSFNGSTNSAGPVVGKSAADVVEPTFYQIYNIFGMTQKGEYSKDYSTYMLKYGQLDFTFEIPQKYREGLRGMKRLPKELIDDPSLVVVKLRHYVSDPSDAYFTKLTWDAIDAYSAYLKEKSKEASSQAQKVAEKKKRKEEEEEEEEKQDIVEPQPVIERPIPQVQEDRGGKQRRKRGGGGKGKRGAEEEEEPVEKAAPPPPKAPQQKEAVPKPEKKKSNGDDDDDDDNYDDDDEDFTRFAGGSGLAFSYSPEPLFSGEVSVLKYWDPVIVKAGYGLILPTLGEDAPLPFGSNVQDVVMRLGSPEGTFYPGRDARLTDVTGDKDQRNVFFYNYFSLGIDVMFDTNSASIVKFVLHSNVPHHKDFNTYAKCNFFVVPERLDGTASAAYKEAKSGQQRSAVTLLSLISVFEDGFIFDHKEELLNVDTVWEDYAMKLGECDEPFINEVSKKKNPFSETFFYIMDGLVVETLPNGVIASLCAYPLP